MTPNLPRQQSIARALSYITVAYNMLEGAVSVAFAMWAGSPALLGFGIDSFVESLSGGVMIWRFSRADDDHRREHTAIRLVGLSLVVLAVYVAFEAAMTLSHREPPQCSPAGLIIAALSLMVMPALYVGKRRTASKLQSRSLAADAKQTLGCMMLSVALLLGTGLHYLIGFWQADPIAALIIAAFLVREGYQAFFQREWCC